MLTYGVMPKPDSVCARSGSLAETTLAETETETGPKVNLQTILAP